MGRGTCKYPTCSNEPEDGSKFCSTKHEVKYDHIKADARDARRDEQRERGVDKKDLPEYDGPPY